MTGLRYEWNNLKFYQGLFGEKVDVAKDKGVISLQRKLMMLPQDREEYTIAAYGSLLNERDISRTMGDKYRSEIGMLGGYQRIFDTASWPIYGSYLNIIKTNTLDSIFVNLITIPKDKLPNYIIREGLYDPIIVECETLDGKKVEAITVINEFGDFGVQPMLNYTHLCIQGIKEQLGKEGVNCMLDNTLCYSLSNHDYITLREWLKTVDLTDLMIRNEYVNR